MTGAIRGRLERFLADARGEVRGVAVLACVPGERHELGLLMLGTLLRVDGWQIAYLGADAPTDDVLELAERIDADVVCLSVTLRENAAPLTRIGRPADLQLVLGGAAANERLARKVGATYLNDNLRRSLRELRRLAR